MQFRTTGNETLGLNIKKQKMFGAIIMKKLEIKNRENSEYPV